MRFPWVPLKFLKFRLNTSAFWISTHGKVKNKVFWFISTLSFQRLCGTQGLEAGGSRAKKFCVYGPWNAGIFSKSDSSNAPVCCLGLVQILPVSRRGSRRPSFYKSFWAVSLFISAFWKRAVSNHACHTRAVSSQYFCSAKRAVSVSLPHSCWTLVTGFAGKTLTRIHHTDYVRNAYNSAIFSALTLRERGLIWSSYGGSRAFLNLILTVRELNLKKKLVHLFQSFSLSWNVRLFLFWYFLWVDNLKGWIIDAN